MVTLLLDQTQLEIVLSPLERAATFHKSNLKIVRSTIVRVQLTDNAWTWLRGVPGPGTHLPGVMAAGTWKATATTDFVMIRGRKPGAVIELEGDEQFNRLLLTTRHGLALTQALRLEVSDQPVDVVHIASTGAIPVTGPKSTRPVIRPRPA